LTPLRRALALLLWQPRLALELDPDTIEWAARDARPGSALLRALVNQIIQQPELTAAMLLEQWRDTEDGVGLRRLADPALIAHIPPEGRRAEFLGAMAALAREARQQQRWRLLQTATPGALSPEQRALLHRTRECGQGIVDSG